MKRLLRSPVANAVLIGVFSAFYSWVFFVTLKKPGADSSLYFKDDASFWPALSDFLSAGHHYYIAWAMIAVTILIVFLLISRRRSYDEYHTSILKDCLIAAIALTLLAIAIFVLLILNDPSNIIEKTTLFIIIHWTTVVFANLAYVLLCRRS